MFKELGEGGHRGKKNNLTQLKPHIRTKHSEELRAVFEVFKGVQDETLHDHISVVVLSML